jgi:hypothetical protein
VISGSLNTLKLPVWAHLPIRLMTSILTFHDSAQKILSNVAKCRCPIYCALEHCNHSGLVGQMQALKMLKLPCSGTWSNGVFSVRFVTALTHNKLFSPDVLVLPIALTPWSRGLLEKLTVSQLVKKFPAFCGTWRFITAYTRARHLSLSWASSIQSVPPHPTSWRSIRTTHLKFCLRS